MRKSNVITKSEELKRLHAGDVFRWYMDTLGTVNAHDLQYIPYEYRRERARMELTIRFQLENAKMQPTEKIAFLIFSIPAVMTCPGATGLCLHNCYARRDERYAKTRASRLSNFVLSFRPDFVEILAEAIHDAVYTKRGGRRKAFEGKQIIVRVHESGDFYNLAYMRNWFEVARRFPDIVFFAYTKSFNILKKCIDEKPENFVVRASIWADTLAEDLAVIEKYGMPFYMALDNVQNVPPVSICDCKAGCGSCGCKCSRGDLKKVVTEIH